MRTGQIIGTVIFGASVAGLCFIYFGYVKPRIDVQREMTQAPVKTTTTK